MLSSHEESQITQTHQDPSFPLGKVSSVNSPLMNHSLGVQNKDKEYQALKQALLQEQARRQQIEFKYQNLFNNSVVGIFKTTANGRYLEVNDTLAQLYGYGSAQDLLKNVQDIAQQLYVKPEQRHNFIKLIRQQGYVSDFKSQIYKQDGSIIWISESAFAVRNSNGQLLYYEGFVKSISPDFVETDPSQNKPISQEIEKSSPQPPKNILDKGGELDSEQKELLAKLEQTQAHLLKHEKLSSLGELVAGIAHEINNPVNFVCGNLLPASQYAEDLINLLKLYQKHCPNPPEEIAQEAEEIDLEFLIEDFPQILASMQVGTERISKIVQSLRHFSRVEDEHLSPVNIQQGLESTLMILRPRLKGKGEYPGVEVNTDYTGLSDRIIGFGGLLNQVFMNLLGNAIDTVEEQHAKNPDHQPTLWITTETEGDYAKITIKDNGMGISPEVRDRIFESFYTTKPTGKGTGLGLSISYDIIVNKHQGSLECHSTPGQGSEFIIKIPLVHPEA